MLSQNVFKLAIIEPLKLDLEDQVKMLKISTQRSASSVFGQVFLSSFVSPVSSTYDTCVIGCLLSPLLMVFTLLLFIASVLLNVSFCCLIIHFIFLGIRLLDLVNHGLMLYLNEFAICCYLFFHLFELRSELLLTFFIKSFFCLQSSRPLACQMTHGDWSFYCRFWRHFRH